MSGGKEDDEDGGGLELIARTAYKLLVQPGEDAGRHHASVDADQARRAIGKGLHPSLPPRSERVPPLVTPRIRRDKLRRR